MKMKRDNLTGLLYETDWDRMILHEGWNYRLEIPAGALVFDLGAFLGSFSKRALELGAGSVVAFEPEPRNWKILKKNLASIPNITLSQTALAGETGQATLYQNVRKDTASHTLYATRGRTPCTISTLSLADAVAKYGEPAVLKADIEGGEYLINWSSLPAATKLLCVEIHLNRGAWKAEAPRLIRDIEALGFTATRQPKLDGKLWNTVGIWQR